MSDLRPILAVTTGDPAGIGPEISLKALMNEEIYDVARPFLIGSAAMMNKVQQSMAQTTQIHVIQDVGDAKFRAGMIDVLDIDNIDADATLFGEVQATCGRASFEYIKAGIELAKSGQVHAVVTGPINKEALRAAHVPYIGHTEMFADLLGAKREMTVFEVETVRIFFLTRHLSLADACVKIADPEFVYTGIRQAYTALQSFIGETPTLAVAGLNPHSGEGGLLGSEENESIRPAVLRAQSEGLQVVGPVPADSVFHFARLGRYDAVLSLYHDQGHIAAKMIDFYKTVSLTLGLPILRTSVDHGTAFDIAGQDKASAISMVEAIRAAARYSPKYQALV